MIVSGPSQVTFVAPQSNVQVDTIVFDLTNHLYTVTYRAPNSGQGASKTLQGAIPAALQTALETHVQKVIEASEGWGNGTSTVVTP